MSRPMQLSTQQLSHFNTFGFLIFRQLLTPAEVETYRREFDLGLDSWIEGRVHDGGSRTFAALMNETTPFIASLGRDARFASVAAQLLSREVICIAVDGNYQVGDTGWHPDTGSLDYLGVKFCIYPDPLTAASGALRVIPGSHLDPFHSAITNEAAEYGITPEGYPAFAFESNPGDVLVFNVGVWHAAFGGDNKRRQGVVVYYEDPQTEAATHSVNKAMAGNHQLFSSLGRELYSDYWRNLDDPQHKHWIARLAELDCLDTPVAN